MPQKKLQVSPGFKLPDNEDDYDPLLNTLYYHYTQQQKQDEERKKLGEVLKFTNPSVQRNLRKQREATTQAPYQTYTDELLSGIPKGFTGTESSVFGKQDIGEPSANTRGVGIGEALGNVPDAALKGIGSVAMLPWWKLKGVLGTEHLLHGTTDTEKMLKGGINYETLGHDDLFGHMFHTARDPNVARIYGSKLMKVAPEENQMIMDLYNPTSDDFARIYSAIKGNKTNERNVKNLFRQSRKGQSVEQPLTQLLREVEPEKLINTGMEGIRHPDVAGGNKEAIAFPKGHFPTDYFTGQPLNQRELSAYHHEVQMLPAGEEQGMRVLRDTSVPYNEIKKGEFRVAGTRKNPDIRNVVDSSSGKKYVIGQEPNNDKPYYIINKKGNQSTQHPTTFANYEEATDYLANKSDSLKYNIGMKSAEGTLGAKEGYDYNPISSDPADEIYNGTKEKPYYIESKQGGPSAVYDQTFATPEEAHSFFEGLSDTAQEHYKISKQHYGQGGQAVVDPDNFHHIYPPTQEKPYYIAHNDGTGVQSSYHVSTFHTYDDAHDYLNSPGHFSSDYKIAHMNTGYVDGPVYYSTEKKYASQLENAGNKNHVYDSPPKGTTPNNFTFYVKNQPDVIKKNPQYSTSINYSQELVDWMTQAAKKLNINTDKLQNYDALKDAINMHASYHGPTIEPDMVGGVSKVKDVSKGSKVTEEAPNFVKDYGEHTKQQLSPQNPYYITNKDGSVSNLGAHPTLASAKSIIGGMESDYKIKKAPATYFGKSDSLVIPKGGQYSQDWENTIHHGIEVPGSTANQGGIPDTPEGKYFAKPDITGKLKGYQVYTPEGKLAYPETFGTKGWAEWWKGKTNNQYLIVKEAGTEGAASTTQKGAALGNDYEAVKQSLAKQGLNPDVLNFSGSPGYVEPIKQGGTNAPDINTSVKDLEIGKPAGGTHGAKNVKYKGEDYIFKPTNGPKFVDDAEYLGTAISRIVNGRTPLANVIQGGTLQKKYPGNFKTIRDLGTHEDFILKHPDQVPFLQQEAVADWLMGNHDSHGGQFLYDDKKHVLVPVDKGQAFKYWDQEKLSPDYHPNAKYGEHEPIQHTLMKMAKDGKVTLYYDVVDDAIKSLQFAFKNNPAYMQGVEKLAKDRYPNDPYEAKIFVDTFKTKLNNLGDDFMKLYSGHTLGKK